MTLQAWLEQQSMTQAQFARLIGSDQGHVSDLITRKVRPKLPSMERIHNATKGAVTYSDWAQEAERKPPVPLKKLLKAVRKTER